MKNGWRKLHNPASSQDIRVKILTDAARALTFLHSSDTNIIFRDVSTSSILLDESTIQSYQTHVVGTFGYIDPEYFKTGQFNSKCDMYGFGVVMVEMLTGLRALDSRRPQQTRKHDSLDQASSVCDRKFGGRYGFPTKW
ncbi:hypothetical protein Leryth_004486 [Lithospermum erythrorhizon]|nr:hypothetical protein Leryth_004486 [Lithospermum erythrorhizon]